MTRFGCFALLIISTISTCSGALDVDQIYFPDQYNELRQTERTPRSPLVSACQHACHAQQATPQYDPVCGSDKVTYANLSRAMCAIRCGKSISIRRGICGPNSPRV